MRVNYPSVDGAHNIGHGHVYKRPDGNVARCGGAGMCTSCANDLARLASTHPAVYAEWVKKQPITAIPSPPVHPYTENEQAFLNARFRRFVMLNPQDQHDMKIAEGVQFQDGKVAVRWCRAGFPKSTVVWDSLQDAIDIHVKAGGWVIEWIDPEGPV